MTVKSSSSLLSTTPWGRRQGCPLGGHLDDAGQCQPLKGVRVDPATQSSQYSERGCLHVCLSAAVLALRSNTHARPSPSSSCPSADAVGLVYVCCCVEIDFSLFHPPSLTANAKPCPPPTPCHPDLPPTLCCDTPLTDALCAHDRDCYFVLE